ncbi:putative nucleic acid-binding protein [Rosa chinensis]|uniref:Putative nucleic acid-binding protein n=1 Tax=Rosa chinensis TaxID=74649 RepID=A0A2P6RU10_ROSCH|nr:putative nucleic acid-binding protein [Rosa chinensis]
MATATANASGATVTAKRKPVFIKVEEIQPGTSGHTLTVKVVSSNPVKVTSKNAGARSSLSSRPLQPLGSLSASSAMRLAPLSSLLAMTKIFDIMTPGTTVILRNAKIDMFKGTMRLAVDKWGRVEVTEPASFEVKEANNLSLVEYELVSVAETDQKS